MEYYFIWLLYVLIIRFSGAPDQSSKVWERFCADVVEKNIIKDRKAYQITELLKAYHDIAAELIPDQAVEPHSYVVTFLLDCSASYCSMYSLL